MSRNNKIVLFASAVIMALGYYIFRRSKKTTSLNGYGLIEPQATEKTPNLFNKTIDVNDAKGLLGVEKVEKPKGGGLGEIYDKPKKKRTLA